MRAKKLPIDVEVYRKNALKAAKDLNYSQKVITVIKHAKTVGELERIMHSARELEWFKEELEKKKSNSQK